MEHDQPAPSAASSDRRLLLRFALGALDLGRARLLAELRAYRGAPEQPSGAVRRRHQVLGALVLAPALLESAVRVARRIYDRGAGRMIGPGVRWLRASRTGQRIAHRCRRLGVRAARQLERWGAIGQAEEAAARALARATFRRVYGEVFDRMTDSAKLQHLIQEHSAGLTRDVVGELRTLSAEADSRAEVFVRRLWRRS